MNRPAPRERRGQPAGGPSGRARRIDGQTSDASLSSDQFTSTFRVRAYECDSLGHVNNAVYIQYLHQTTLDALGVTRDGAGLWDPRALSIEYRATARYGDVLTVATWVIDAENGRARRGYTITCGAEDTHVVSARIEWEYRDRATRGVHSVPSSHCTAPSTRVPVPHRPFVRPGDNGALPFRWRHTVRRYELDATGNVVVAAYFNWLEEATFRAAQVVGWSLENMRAANVITLQYRHDAEFLATASNGDEVEIVSRLVDVRRVRGTWIHEIYRLATNTLLARDYSTGTFLDRDGNIRVPPKAMMDALVRGGPTEGRG